MIENQPLISVISIAYNRPRVIEKFIKSVYASSYKNIEIIVSNNSDGEYKTQYDKTLRAYPDAVHLWNGENRLIAGAWNAGLRIAKGDIIILCGDDYVFEESAINHLKESLESDKQIGVAGPIMYFSDTNQVLNAGNTFSFSTGTISLRKPQDRDYEVDIIDSIIAVKKEVIEKAGLFDERNFPFYLESADLCMRTRKAGFKCFISAKAGVWHTYEAKIALRVPEPDRYTNILAYYYLMKTKVRFIRKYASFPQKIIFFCFFIYLLTAWHLSVIILRSKDRPLAKAYSMIKGVLAGALGRL